MPPEIDVGSTSTGSGSTPGANERFPGRKLTLPAWVILDKTYSGEKEARARLALIQRAGIANAGYYWIPDLFPSGKEIFQVYAGPAADEAAARKAVCEFNARLRADSYAALVSAKGREVVVRCTETPRRRRPG